MCRGLQGRSLAVGALLTSASIPGQVNQSCSFCKVLHGPDSPQWMGVGQVQQELSVFGDHKEVTGLPSLLCPVVEEVLLDKQEDCRQVLLGGLSSPLLSATPMPNSASASRPLSAPSQSLLKHRRYWVSGIMGLYWGRGISVPVIRGEACLPHLSPGLLASRAFKGGLYGFFESPANHGLAGAAIFQCSTVK